MRRLEGLVGEWDATMIHAWFLDSLDTEMKSEATFECGTEAFPAASITERPAAPSVGATPQRAKLAWRFPRIVQSALGRTVSPSRALTAPSRSVSTSCPASFRTL